MKIPYFRAQIKDLTNESVILRYSKLLKAMESFLISHDFFFSFGVLSMFSARSCAFFWYIFNSYVYLYAIRSSRAD